MNMDILPSNIEVRLTTKDNPFDPFDEFESWYMFDMQNGYYSCSKVARVVESYNSMTEDEQLSALNEAIDRIIAADPFDIYVKVYRKSDNFTPLDPEEE